MNFRRAIYRITIGQADFLICARRLYFRKVVFVKSAELVSSNYITQGKVGDLTVYKHFLCFLNL